jgi:hypothetical protein
MSPRPEDADPLGKRALDWLDRWLPVAGSIVPPHRRLDWMKEWQAEMWQLRHGRRGAAHRSPGEILSLAYGLVADAAWLRLDWARYSARGSAASCLVTLFSYCVLCAAMELELAGSWHVFVQTLTVHFFGGFVFVAAPAMVAAVGTYPLRPVRCDGQHAGVKRILSARTRWNLFLGAKVALTLSLGFLVSVVAVIPARMAVGRYADWVELLVSSLLVTVGLRWALLNQEQRCQKCLRMLSGPTRVGAPSRNFLEWSGTELACTEGHGLLHVPEMQGSWCWYDRWVERDAGWGGIFTA